MPSSTLLKAAAALLLLAGLLVRLPHLSNPPLGFHPTRQYRSAIIARALYLDSATGLSAAERTAAVVAASHQSPIEPPVLEHAAAFAYRVAGHESLTMARLISVLAWTLGGLALWWLAAQLFATPAAVAAAVAVMMFTPYGIRASQAFQPDALMTTLMVAALATIVRHDRTPGRPWLLLVGVSVAAALFVKPMSGLFVVPALLVLAIRRSGWRRGILFSLPLVLIASVATAVWYTHVARVAPDVLENRLFPELWRTAGFWSDWLGMLLRVAPLPLVAAGLVGVALGVGRVRTLLVALSGGYLVLGLVFAHHIHTHDYYSLPIIPVVALSVGALIEAIAAAAPEALHRRSTVAAVLVLIVTGAGAGVRAAGVLQPAGQFNAEVSRYEAIGRVVGHSTNVASLDGSYGFPIEYHGYIAATNWPLSIDFAAGHASASGTPVSDRLAASGADFFVATLQPELDGQPDLRAVLNERYPILDRQGDPDHWQSVVYDLRGSRVSTRPARLSVFATTNGERYSENSIALWSAPKGQWRVEVPAGNLFDVLPASGTGPATLHVVPRKHDSAIDKTVEVPIYLGGGNVPSTMLTVRFKSVTSAGAAAPFGFVDAPADPIVLGAGAVVLQGWALDDFDLRRVWVGRVDSSGKMVAVGDATREGMRPDVAAASPGSHDLFNCAWVFTLQPQALKDVARPVVLHVFAEDGDGHRAEIGRRSIQ